jgi:hypothetical protein
MRCFILLLIFFSSSSAVFARQKAPVVFAGESFRNNFRSNTSDGGKVVEFVRKEETVHKWTKLVAFRYQKRPNIANDPTKAAVEMGRLVKASNPKAGYRVIPGRDEALVDFTTWPRHRKYVEFSVVRYGKSADGKGLLSLQFGYRFSDTSPEGIKKFKRQRLLWMQEVAAFDFRKVASTLSD